MVPSAFLKALIENPLHDLGLPGWIIIWALAISTSVSAIAKTHHWLRSPNMREILARAGRWFDNKTKPPFGPPPRLVVKVCNKIEFGMYYGFSIIFLMYALLILVLILTAKHETPLSLLMPFGSVITLFIAALIYWNTGSEIRIRKP
jgi:hypothetical protein